MGNLLKVVVHPANIQDPDGAKLVLTALPDEVWERLERIWADSNYSGELEFWVEDTFEGVVLDIVRHLPDQVGFVVLPKRWIVERTCSCDDYISYPSVQDWGRTSFFLNYPQ